jgi:hypothetical protein
MGGEPSAPCPSRWRGGGQLRPSSDDATDGLPPCVLPEAGCLSRTSIIVITSRRGRADGLRSCAAAQWPPSPPFALAAVAVAAQ